MKNIAILCSGGDVSGMNPALKKFVEYSLEKGLTPYFIYDGFEGLIDNEIRKADYCDVAGIINRGGTKIGSARSKRFMKKKFRQIAKENLDNLSIDMLLVLGGDGSFQMNLNGDDQCVFEYHFFYNTWNAFVLMFPFGEVQKSRTKIIIK